jgi:tetratricopeptide (TPR) repeat protein
MPPKTAHELTRKEMKGPDRFQVAAADAAHWMAGKQKQLLVAILAVIALAVLVVAVTTWRESNRREAGGLLYRALDAAGGEVSSIQLPNFDRPIYKSEEEKARAVLAVAEQVRQQHGGSTAAVTAALVEGDAQLGLRAWDKAIEAYQRFLTQAPADDSMRFAAYDGLARAQEGKGDRDAAAKTYDEATRIEFYKDRALLEKARVLAAAGKLDDARKAAEAVAKDSKDPALQAQAQERLSRLSK